MQDFMVWIWHLLISVANADEVDHVITHQAPGFTWNISLGQLVQLVGMLVPIIIMWNKGQVRHAMQMRDMAEMRRDITQLDGRMARMDDYMRQVPAIIAGMQRGFAAGNIIMGKRQGGEIHANSPATETLREQYGFEDENPEVFEKAIDLLKKMTSHE